jgi:hypothetical protein
LVSYIRGGLTARVANSRNSVSRVGLYCHMTTSTYEISSDPRPSLRASAHRPHVRVSLSSHEQADLIARGLPPELAFLATEGFSPEPLFNDVVAAPKAVRGLDHLLSEGQITEEVYYRALATHLSCEYYSGDPPLARAFDAVKGLRCGVAPSNRAVRVLGWSLRLVRSSLRG